MVRRERNKCGGKVHPLVGIVAAIIPGVPGSSEQIFPALCYSLGCPVPKTCRAQTWFSVVFSVCKMCQNRTNLHRGKCGDSGVKPVGLTGVPLQASKEILDHWNWTLSLTWAISRPGIVWIRINFFIAKMNLPILCSGSSPRFTTTKWCYSFLRGLAYVMPGTQSK